MTAMIGLVKLLGFECSADKLHEFGLVSAMLGVEVNCKNWKAGSIVVKNKEPRCKEINELVANLVEGDHLTSREFLSIVGRLQFAEAQVMGRMGKLALSRIRTWMSQQRILVTQELLEEFRLLAERFRREKPREVPMLVDSKSVLVFTDGASEENCHTVGGVLVFPDGTSPRFFGAYVPGALVDGWFSAMKHIIGPVETYALVVARSVWHQHGSHWPWFSRVPSASNCADDPTRVGHVLGKFLHEAVRDRCLCPITGLELSDFVGST